MPGSRLLCPDRSATVAAGVRLIGFDRPGYGGSDPKPGRTIADGADDVGAVADALGIDRFAVVGWSSGGAYALGCAARLGERVTAVADVAGDAPIDEFPEVLAALPERIRGRIPRIRAGDPEAFAELRERMAPMVSDPTSIFAGDDDPSDPDARLNRRPAVLAALDAWLREGLRQGDEGWVEDWVATFTPWGFRLAEVDRPVRVWRGDADRLSQAADSELIAAAIPGATLTVIAGEGHSIAETRWSEILAGLAEAAD
jgi:pimeloyl-ACP methyl ester carboxylesterase